ncbi:hypothetical protein AALH12_07175 [Streptococcus ferus]|uniref:hypothetical protein n=1 Tax=Streptococcus ferus TaxID=1345 RepID=UPI0035193BB4
MNYHSNKKSSENSDYNDRLNQFFNIKLARLTLNDKKKYNEIAKLNKSELKKRYVELKAETDRSEKLTYGILATVAITFILGLFAFFKKNVQYYVSRYGPGKQTGILTSGLFLFLLVVLIILILSMLYYYRKIKLKKMEYYYIELLMKEKGLL